MEPEIDLCTRARHAREATMGDGYPRTRRPSYSRIRAGHNVTGELETDLFADDPITEPMTYPGRIPDTSGVLIDAKFHSVRAAAGAEPEQWHMSSTLLSKVLQQHGGSPMSARVPVVAVGSNAAPSQLVRKFATRSVRPLVPVTLSDVSNLVPGVSAHVSKPGYIPAVPVKVPGAASRLSVLWLCARHRPERMKLRVNQDT